MNKADIKNRLFHWVNTETTGQTFDLSPILRLLERIPNSPEFTRLPPLFDASENFPIADMYVELMVARTRGLAQPRLLQQSRTIADEQEARRQQHTSRHLSIHQCINMPQHHKIVILGDPGSGKTSLLKYLCLEIASGNNPRWLVPVFISLRRYWLEKHKKPEITLLHYAAISLFDSSPDKGRPGGVSWLTDVESLLLQLTGYDRANVLFLLDGFDEIATNRAAIEAISEDIKQLGNTFAWVLTSRHTGFFGDVGEDVCYDIISLNKAGIEELVESWFTNSHLAHKHPEKQALLSQIDTNPRLRDMAGNPFLLTLLCHIQQNQPDSQLPLHRSDVYASILYLIRLQLRNAKKDNQLFREQEMGYLSRFCHYLYAHADNAPLQIFEYDHWDRFALPDTPPDFDRHFLPSRLINSWRQGGDFHFVHLTFQEYLIALHIARHSFDAVKAYLFNPYWKMVFRFLAGIYSKQTDHKNLQTLLTTLLSPPDKMGLLYLEAGRFLIEANTENSTALLGYDLRDKLWELWVGNADYAKESAGEILAILSPAYILNKIFKLHRHWEQAKQDYQAWRPVGLLGFIHNTVADELILRFLQTEEQQVRGMAFAALAEKNTHALRQAVIALYHGDSTKHFGLLCAAARATKHKDFLACLKPCLATTPEKIEDYSPLFQAITAMGATEFMDDLLRFAQHYPLNALPDDLIEAVLSLQTSASIQWLGQALLLEDQDFRDSVLYYAIQYNLLPEKQLLTLFDSGEEDSLFTYLNAVVHQSQEGMKPGKAIIRAVIRHISTETNVGVRALTVLEQSDFIGLLEDDELQELKNRCYAYLDHVDIEIVINAISILSRLRDIQAYPKIKQLATSDKKRPTQPMAVDALAKYKDIYRQDITETLHTLFAQFRDVDTYFAQNILTVLAEVDLQATFRYLSDPITHEAITVFCAREGVLVFDDGFIDKAGVKYHFKASLPKLDANLPAREQLETLRMLCHYALETEMVRKTTANKGGIPPLFTKYQEGTNENRFPNGVDIVTGNKFLSGKPVSNDSAQKIMWRLQAVCPELFV
ncbi:MAG: NACHT domain-containing protein [Candidatus Thiothrix moscowensis]|nr:NACHT domain-containing protein [Candidatus Thiothrix moscowensis]